MMRIVSLNCWVGRVPNPLFDFIPAIDADVYCLQEVTWAAPSTPFYAHFRYKHKVETRPHYTNLFERFGKTLPDHYGSYYPVAEFDVFDDDDRPWPIRFGLATFVRKKYATLNSCSLFTHGEYWPGALKDPPVPTRAHAFVLWRPETKAPLIVAHMHGIWHPDGKGDTLIRQQHFLAFEEQIKRVRNYEFTPTVICGDFNILPDNSFLSHLRHLGYQELMTGGGYKTTRTSFYEKTNVPYADYMLVRDVVPERFEVVYEPEVSDHCPLVLDIK